MSMKCMAFGYEITMRTWVVFLILLFDQHLGEVFKNIVYLKLKLNPKVIGIVVVMYIID